MKVAEASILKTYDRKTGTYYGYCPNQPGIGIFSGKSAYEFMRGFDRAYTEFSLTDAFRQSDLCGASALRTPTTIMSVEEEAVFKQRLAASQSAPVPAPAA